MYCLIDFCCICFCNKEHLKHLSDSDGDNLTYLTKLTSSVSEMCFNEINEQWLVCKKCCKTMDVAYKFRQRCLKSKATLTDYISQLNKDTNISDKINVYISDINKFINLKKENQKQNIIKKNKLLISEFKDTNKEKYCDINPITDMNKKNNPNSQKLIDTGDKSIPFENVVIKMERDDQYFEENVDESFDNPLINHDNIKIDSQNDILTTSAINKNNQDFQERLNERFDNISKKCDSANDEIAIKIEENEDYSLNTEKCSDDPLINLNEIKIDIVDNDIESVNAEINISCKSEYNEEFTKEDHVIPLEDEDEADNVRFTIKEGKESEIQKKAYFYENSCRTAITTTSKKTLIKSTNPQHKDTSIKIHSKPHTTKKTYKCEICQKEIVRASALKDHMRIHTGEKPHCCTICNKKFTQSSTLRKHVRTHTGLKPHECKICHKKFTQSAILKNHLKFHTGEKPHECEICHKKFTLSASLKNHMKIHTGAKTHQCSECEKKFQDSSALRAHMIIHTGETPYECSLCRKKFARSANLRTHMLFHAGDKPNECSLCQKKFTLSATLRNHMKIHTGEKPYACVVCLKKFAQSGNLRMHMRIHTA